MKFCVKCREMYPFDRFHTDNSRFDKKDLQCKNCRILGSTSKTAYAQNYRQTHSSTIKEKASILRKDPLNKAKNAEYNKRYRTENKDRLNLKRRTKQAATPKTPKRSPWTKEKDKEAKRKWRADNKQYISDKRKTAEFKQKTFIKKQSIRNTGFCINHPSTNAVTRGFCDECRFKKNVAASIRNSIKKSRNRKESTKTVQILGLTIPEFIGYIETKFLLGMDWEGFGKIWQLDHIKPLATAGPNCSPKEIFELNHYTNFQPLFTAANYLKGSWFQGNRYKEGKIVSVQGDPQPDWDLLNKEISSGLLLTARSAML